MMRRIKTPNKAFACTLIGSLFISAEVNSASLEIKSTGGATFRLISNDIVFLEVESIAPIHVRRAVSFEMDENALSISGYTDSEVSIELVNAVSRQARVVSGVFEVDFHYSSSPDYHLRDRDFSVLRNIKIRSHSEAASTILNHHDGDPTCMLQGFTRVRSSFPSELTLPALEDLRLTDVASFNFGNVAACREGFAIEVAFCTSASTPRELCAISKNAQDVYGLVLLPTAHGAVAFNALSRRDLMSALRN